MRDQNKANREGGCGSCRKLRGEIFTELDRLAFALEMEASEVLSGGESEKALRLENQRLGVRLAQRLVADVRTDEVHPRLERWDEEYEARQSLGERVEAGARAG